MSLDGFVVFGVQVQGLMGMITSLWEKFGEGLSDHQFLNKDFAAWCSNKMPLYDVILPVRSTELQCLAAWRYCGQVASSVWLFGVTVARRLALSDVVALLWPGG